MTDGEVVWPFALTHYSLPDANPSLSSGQAATAPASALGAPTPGDLIPGASPRKKPRKQQHVISTEESEMVETNSTDEEKAPGRPVNVRSERRESPPREYVGACRSADSPVLDAVSDVNVSFFFLHVPSCRRGRRALRPRQAPPTRHTPAPLPQPLESCLPPLPEVQRHQGQRWDARRRVKFSVASSSERVKRLSVGRCRGEEGLAAGHGQSERSGLQSTGLENPPVCRTAATAGEFHYFFVSLF